MTFVAVCLILACVALLASYLTARHAENLEAFR
jgi:hypothetical protein